MQMPTQARPMNMPRAIALCHPPAGVPPLATAQVYVNLQQRALLLGHPHLRGARWGVVECGGGAGAALVFERHGTQRLVGELRSAARPTWSCKTEPTQRNARRKQPPCRGPVLTLPRLISALPLVASSSSLTKLRLTKKYS